VYNLSMNRLKVLTAIKQSLKRIDGRTSPWDPDYTFSTDVHGTVVTQDLYVEEINSFPILMVTVMQELISHTGGGQRWSALSFRVRGVIWDEDAEQAGEQLADDVEHVISNVRRENTQIEEIRIDTIQTDEGINRPLAAVIIQGTALYQHE
jgi:hypothetical protein